MQRLELPRDLGALGVAGRTSIAYGVISAYATTTDKHGVSNEVDPRAEIAALGPVLVVQQLFSVDAFKYSFTMLPRARCRKCIRE